MNVKKPFILQVKRTQRPDPLLQQFRNAAKNRSYAKHYFFFLILNVIRTQLELKEKQVISSAEFYQMKVSNLKKYIFVGKDSAHLKF